MTETAEHREKFDEAVNSEKAVLLFRIPGKEIESSFDLDFDQILIKGWNQERLDMNALGSDGENILPENTSREIYDRSFSAYQQELKKDTVKKAILSAVILEEKPQHFHAVEFFFTLTENYPKAFTYLLYHPETGMWTGASPEIILSGAKTRYHTVALAGTQVVNGKNVYEWGTKELEEQELVSQHIRDTLMEVGATAIQEEGPYTTRAGNVVHLKSDFDFEYTGDIDELLQHLHPTPAVAGLPVKVSIDLIERTEQHRRGLYTGLIGLIGRDETHIYVNLRCMQIGEEKLAIYVGGGLTEKSENEAEWEETRIKAKTLLNLLKP